MGMHYLAGAVRGLMSVSNLRGPLASLMREPAPQPRPDARERHRRRRAAVDRPRDELLIDVSHEALYALVTGTISDALIPRSPTSTARRRGLRTRAKGFA